MASAVLAVMLGGSTLVLCASEFPPVEVGAVIHVSTNNQSSTAITDYASRDEMVLDRNRQFVIIFSIFGVWLIFWAIVATLHKKVHVPGKHSHLHTHELPGTGKTGRMGPPL